jgi:hypothetical protein
MLWRGLRVNTEHAQNTECTEREKFQLENLPRWGAGILRLYLAITLVRCDVR